MNAGAPKCLVCGSPVESFLSFGRMPVANGFLGVEEFSKEYFYELEVGFCPACTMVQLVHLLDRERLFHENYAYFSSTSRGMVRHFEAFADRVLSDRADSDPFVVEIGSNDGILLQFFARKRIRHLGVEPSANVARAAMDKGIRTVCRFFDEPLAEEILKEHGPADVILGANVLCHIPYLHSVGEGVRRLLKPGGALVFEDPYWGEVVDKTAYDQIYDEHAFYFTVSSVERLFGEHGLELVDVAPQGVHGGSMRYTLAPRGTRRASPAVEALRRKEEEGGLHRRETFQRFKRDVERSRDRLRELLESLRRKGARVVGYGATSKSTTVVNYCRISPELVEFISDTTPTKQGKFSPGMHIPVRPYEAFVERYPEYALLFAWNHKEEILAKEAGFRSGGGKFITYVPEVGVE